MSKQCIYIVFLLACVAFSLNAKDTKKNTPGKQSSLSVADQRKFDYFYYEGLNLKSANKFDAAYDAFNYCLVIDSTSSAVLYELSAFYVQLNQSGKAVDFLKRAVEYSADNFTYRLALASLSRNEGMFGEASNEYNTLIKEHPDKPELNYYLAESLTQEGEIDEAIKAYDKLELSMGMSEGISMQKYSLYTQLKQPAQALKEIEKLADKYPMEARYPIILGDLCLEKNDTTNALVYYNKAHSIDPGNPYYIVSMANYYEATNNKDQAETQIRNALTNTNLDVETKVSILSRYILKLQQSQKGTESTNALFQTLLEQHPEDINLKQMYGNLLVVQGKMQEARFQFQLATEMAPQDPSAWLQLLKLSLQSEDYPEVIRICTKCQELFPKSPEYYFYLGIAYYQQKKYQDAIDIYTAGLKIIPGENSSLKSDFYGQIGDIYYQMDQRDKAYQAYEDALKLNENNIVVLNNYSYFLSLSKQDLKKAERMSATCIKIEPDNATYLDTYAWIFFIQENYMLAKIYIERAIEKDTTKSAELADHYGDILFMTNEKEKAIMQWKKAKELGKESDVLNRKISEGKYIEDQNAK